jgi:hypothetical protein
MAIRFSAAGWPPVRFHAAFLVARRSQSVSTASAGKACLKLSRDQRERLRSANELTATGN